MNELSKEEFDFIHNSFLKLFLLHNSAELDPVFDRDIPEEPCILIRDNRLVESTESRVSIDLDYSLAQIYSFAVQFLLDKKRENTEKNFNSWYAKATEKLYNLRTYPTLAAPHNREIYSKKLLQGSAWFKPCPDIPAITLIPSVPRYPGIIAYRPATDSLSIPRFGLLITMPNLVSCY